MIEIGGAVMKFNLFCVMDENQNVIGAKTSMGFVDSVRNSQSYEKIGIDFTTHEFNIDRYTTTIKDCGKTRCHILQLKEAIKKYNEGVSSDRIYNVFLLNEVTNKLYWGCSSHIMAQTPMESIEVRDIIQCSTLGFVAGKL